LAWENIPTGSCSGLKNHIEQFPDGPYYLTAAVMLQARQKTFNERWVSEQQRLPLYVTIGVQKAAKDEESAKQFAADRGQADVDKLCQGYAATGSYRFQSASSEVKVWTCDEMSAGHYCGFDGEAVCSLERLERTAQYTCGK